jgi:phospholipid/cholesterol/gamma-HCH transport system substrate-binding protein
MNQTRVELVVGIFVLIGLVALAYLSIRLGKLDFIGTQGYRVVADFDSIAGLKPGAMVEIAGVEVGRVESIRLNKQYQAAVAFRIKPGVILQDDAIASVKTKGLIGEKYVRITPGGSDKVLGDGGVLRETESPTELEDLIAKFIHGKI